MTDYSRPQAQWQDLPSTGSDLVAWALDYDPLTGYITLEPDARAGHSGLVLDSYVGGVRTWVLVESVNGEQEMAVGYSDTTGIVHIFA